MKKPDALRKAMCGGAAACALSACAMELPDPVACNVEPYLIAMESFSSSAESLGDDGLSPFERAVRDAIVKTDDPGAPESLGPPEPKTLALSGGGPWGAYGAGFLNAWREHRQNEENEDDIPAFAVVTGVSTGALQSTFAFLGGDELDRLEELYRTVENDDIFDKRNTITALLSKNALNSLDPLRKTLRREITERGLIEKVALEAAKGRLLLVGMVDLNTGKLFAGDLTKVATDDALTPDERAECYADLLVASAAVPASFDPVHTVSPDNQRRVFVDGGVRAAVFIESVERAAETISEASGDRIDTAVIINGMLDVCQNPVKGGILNITGRSVGVLINENNRDSLEGVVTRRSEGNQCTRYSSVDFRDEFCAAGANTTNFDPAFMRALADQARTKWENGDAFEQAGQCAL